MYLLFLHLYLILVNLIINHHLTTLRPLHHRVLFPEPFPLLNLLLEFLSLFPPISPLLMQPDYLFLHDPSVDPLLADHRLQPVIILVELFTTLFKRVVMLGEGVDCGHKEVKGVTAAVNAVVVLKGP